MDINMTEEQHEFVAKYQSIYDRLAQLESRMLELKAESKSLIDELETLREEERKKFKTEE